MMKRLYLIDVSSIFFRSFYAIRHLNNSKGIPTNALYGFLAALVKLLKEHKPDGVVFCFDRPETGFREKIYPEYKANRDEAPTDLVAQIPYLPKLAEALAIPAFERPGFEADDIIGTLVEKSRRHGIEVIIVSGDKDFAQLIQPGVRMYDPSKDAFTDDDGVRAKFGVSPGQMIDYQALVGDSSDNVPGVKGIGPKGAVKLLTEYKNLDGIYEHIDDIKNDRLREMLRSQKDMAYLSQKLVTIHCDMDIKLEPEDFYIRPVKRELLVPLLEELEFKSLLQRLLGEGLSGEGDAGGLGPSAPSFKGRSTPRTSSEDDAVDSASSGATAGAEASVKVLTEFKKTPVEITAAVEELNKALQKTKSKDLWIDVTSRGTALQIGKTVYRYEGNSVALTDWLNDVLVQNTIALKGYDTKGMAHQLHLTPEAFHTVSEDVLLQAYCTGRGIDLDLNALAKLKLGAEMPEFALPEDRLFAAQQLSRVFDDELKVGHLQSVLDDIEQPLVPVLYGMERTGVLIDSEKLGDFSKELLHDVQGLEKEISKLAGYEFNVGSPKQLGQVLFEKLKLPVVRKTKTGYSTDSDVLDKLKTEHPIAEKIVEWRELTKLRSTYVDALPRLADPLTGRVHTTFNQAVTATGRLSSTNPNLQNIPIRTAKGQRIRESFIAPEGSVLVSADYSQVELRILAHITGDANLKRAFEQDLDIHTATAAEVFGVKLENVTQEQRRASKAINFGIAYGMSDFGLAENLGIDRKEAADFINRYFQRFPGVQQYIHDVVEEGKKNLFVETMFGRRRYYPELGSSNGRVRQMAERAAINMPIQGAAADIIKKAMITIAAEISDFGPGCLLLQVHDELVFQVKQSRAADLEKKVKSWMENAVKISVPLKVSVGAGKNWGLAH